MHPLRLQIVGLALALVAGAGCAHSRPARPTVPHEFPPEMSDEAVLRAKWLMVPVSGVAPRELRDTYAAPRGNQRHEALDILAPRGTPVVAADDGLILRLRTNDAGGMTIYQRDPASRFVYYYAHLDRYRDGLREGMTVAQGDVIGYVGTTGNAPANVPHLHFQLMRNPGSGRYSGGMPLNPFPFLVRDGATVAAPSSLRSR